MPRLVAGGYAEERFGSAVPAFHPKFYLTTTKSMADETEAVTTGAVSSEWAINRRRSCSDEFLPPDPDGIPRDTFKSQTQGAFLDVCLSDGSNIRLYTQTLDTAERILQVVISLKISLW
ncbi:hypothetical protein Nmel_001827 [Mimus melanotis]